MTAAQLRNPNADNVAVKPSYREGLLPSSDKDPSESILAEPLASLKVFLHTHPF